MPKQDWKTLTNKLEKEIYVLKEQLRKREEILQNLKSLEEISGGGVRRRRGRKPRKIAVERKPVLRKRVGRPGRKPGPVRRGRRRIVRRIGMPKTADVMIELLSRMPQPATIEDLTQKVHNLYPKMGGVKYRSVVSSIASRDDRFERVRGNKVILKARR
jgi:hypothetical protein